MKKLLARTKEHGILHAVHLYNYNNATLSDEKGYPLYGIVPTNLKQRAMARDSSAFIALTQDPLTLDSIFIDHTLDSFCAALSDRRDS